MPAARQATLGFSVHTGWAAVVAIAGKMTEPEVVDRRRVELLDGDSANTDRFVYHKAAEMGLPAARKFVDSTTKQVHKATLAAIKAAVSKLSEEGLRVTRAAIIGGNSGAQGELEVILKSHSAIHTAEGELYRGAVATACHSLKLAIRPVSARELVAQAASGAGLKPASVEKYVADMKRAVGAPWAQDQKQAMMAAWAALGAKS
jgi:hypothetical protein